MEKESGLEEGAPIGKTALFTEDSVGEHMATHGKFGEEQEIWYWWNIGLGWGWQ